MSLFTDHMQRLKTGANRARNLNEVSRWITENTKIKSKPYSYKDHEYQPFVLDAAEPEWVIQKCSQIGISEMSFRLSLALCSMIRGFTVAYTLPTAKFAVKVMQTRINPIIKDSDALMSMVEDIDNSEVKQLGDSFLYLKGAASSNAPISVPCDMRIHDEVDFSDPVILSQYQSRLTHSPYKFKGLLSTPTLPDKGINYEFKHSRQHFNIAKCSCCNHYFIPDYYDHVVIPGYTGDLRSINKANLHKVKYKEAFVQCPRCGGKPDLSPKYREWVRKNPDDNYAAFGVQITPFDAPALITPAFLVESSTQYKRSADFVNFGLGLAVEDKESILVKDELRALITSSFNLDSGYSYVMGVDLGMTCWITVCAVHWSGSIRVVHTEGVHVSKLKQRYLELRVQFRVRVSVMDSAPFLETVLALQKQDPNLFGAVYVESRIAELYKITDKDADPDEGKQALRQVNISRNRTFDALMEFIRSGQVSKKPDENDETWVNHLTDMKRIKDWDAKTEEIVFRWVKSSEGDDHLHHSLLYAYIASMIIGVSKGSTVSLPLVSKFKVETPT